MKIRQDQLVQVLQKGLSSTYLVSGDEPLLVMEACQQIRQAALQQGFDERQVFHADASFNWADLTDEANAMSLFSSRKILEVRINNGKPSDKGAALKEISTARNPDNILLIICPRLDAAAQRTAWVKAADENGVFLPVWPIERNQYMGWLKHRIQNSGLQIEQDALAMLAHHTEGNLLAAVQEIEKLKLLGESSVSIEILGEAITNNSRFNAFQLADACLLGNIANASHILSQLKAEGVEPILILGALVRKTRQLISLKPLQPQQLSAAFKQQGIWPKQQPPFQKALQNLEMTQLNAALKKAEAVDHAVKGSGEDPWRLLHELVIQLNGNQLKVS